MSFTSDHGTRFDSVSSCGLYEVQGTVGRLVLMMSYSHTCVFP